MEFREVVRRRHMVRNFEPHRPVPPEARERILEHAQRAPSAGFTQGWAFLVLDVAADRDLFWTATAAATAHPSGGWLDRMRTAPLLVIAMSSEQAYRERYAETDKAMGAPPDQDWPVPYWHVDAGLAALLMALTAVDEGLGACFFGVPAAGLAPLRAAFGVPATFAPVGVVAIGYPAPGPRSPSLRRGRRAADDVVHRGRW